MKDQSNYIKLHIPENAQLDTGVGEACNKVTQQLGGVVGLNGQGGWVDGDETHNESVTVFQWNFSDNNIPLAKALTSEVVDALFAYGEIAVFRERSYTVKAVGHQLGGYRAGTIYGPARH